MTPSGVICRESREIGRKPWRTTSAGIQYPTTLDAIFPPDRNELPMLPVSQTLTPEQGLIFRITHRDNVAWILGRNG